MISTEVINFSKKYLLNYDFEGPIIITGATGLIGRSLIQALEVSHPNIEIYALCRNEDKLRKTVSRKVNYVYYNLLDPINLNVKNAHIIHCAAPTSSYDFYHKANLIFDQIITSTENIVEYAKMQDARSIMYLSTLEIYGEPSEKIPLKERDYRGLDPLNPRNSYALAKLSAENRLSFYSKSMDIPIYILRLSQVIGVPSSYQDNRVIFYFARQIIEGETIELQTRGNTVRNYLYYLDLIEVIYFLLENKTLGINVYNVANELMEISVKELAEKYIDINNSDISLEFVKQTMDGFRDDLYLVLDTEKIKQLGWEPKYDLDLAIQSLMVNMKKLKKDK